MKPDSSPSPDENAPSKGAGSHGQKGPQDLREQDLWDFADETETPAEAPSAPESAEKQAPETPAEHAPQPVTLTPRGLRKDDLPFRAKQTPKPKRSGQKDDSKGEDGSESPQISISKTPAPPPRKVEDAFDDLDASESEETAPSTKPTAKAPDKSDTAEPKSAKTSDSKPKEEDQPETADATATDSEDQAEAPPAAEPPAPSPLVPKISLSKVEKIALISVLALLAFGSIFFIANSVYKIPEKHVWLNEGDFPIKGNSLEAVKAQTYWRAPAAGEGRIGTALLPVIDLELSGGPAAVRVFFRNAKGESAGDAFTKSVSGATTLKIAGTAGFEDLGLHAAYRTTDTDRWIVEVYEGPSVDAPIHTFKKLFELPISTDRR